MFIKRVFICDESQETWYENLDVNHFEIPVTLLSS